MFLTSRPFREAHDNPDEVTSNHQMIVEGEWHPENVGEVQFWIQGTSRHERS
jgi:hypothetical protein